MLFLPFYFPPPFFFLPPNLEIYEIHFLCERKLAMVLVYVIAWVGVKFGINFTRVGLSGKWHSALPRAILLPLNLTRVKFVLEIS